MGIMDIHFTQVLLMPYKNYSDKLRWNALHNPNRVKNGTTGEHISLNKIKPRTYVCELCGSIWNTQFHHYNHNNKHVLEVCEECHSEIHNQEFKEDKIK